MKKKIKKKKSNHKMASSYNINGFLPTLISIISYHFVLTYLLYLWYIKGDHVFF